MIKLQFYLNLLIVLKKLLFELKEYLGGEKEIQISRELTKKFEEQIGNNINEVINFFEGKEILGEITILLKGSIKLKLSQNLIKLNLKKELNDLIKAG